MFVIDSRLTPFKADLIDNEIDKFWIDILNRHLEKD